MKYPKEGQIYSDKLDNYLMVIPITDRWIERTVTVENTKGNRFGVGKYSFNKFTLEWDNPDKLGYDECRRMLMNFHDNAVRAGSVTTGKVTTDLHVAGAKDDTGKPDVSLLFEGFPRALLAVAEVGTFGAKKYTRGGWQTVPDGINRYTAAMGRHQLLESIDEGSIDIDSGLSHASMVAWNAIARLELMLRANGTQL